MLRLAGFRFVILALLRRSRSYRFSVILLISFVSFASVASEEEIPEEEMILSELMHREKSLSVIMHVLLGEVSNKRGNAYNARDEKEIAKAIATAPYLGRFFQKMEEACLYYRATPINSVDTTILTAAQSEAQRVELIDKISFFESTLNYLSPETTNLANQLRDSAISNQAKSLNEPLDFYRVARDNPDGYKENFRLVCQRVDKMKLRIQSDESVYNESPITIRKE